MASQRRTTSGSWMPPALKFTGSTILVIGSHTNMGGISSSSHKVTKQSTIDNTCSIGAVVSSHLYSDRPKSFGKAAYTDSRDCTKLNSSEGHF